MSAASPVPIVTPYGGALVDERLPLGYVIAGDEVLCDLSAYGDGDRVWARVDAISPGTASVYPIKVRCPDGGPGQIRATEVLEQRTPDPIRMAREYIDAERERGGPGPGWCEEPTCPLPLPHRATDHA